MVRASQQVRSLSPNNLKKLIALLSFFALTSAAVLYTQNWQPLPGSKINFTIDGMFGKDVKGTIGNLSATIEFYPDDPSASFIKAGIKPASIDTRNKKRDAHLRTADFFEVESYPDITFVSKAFGKQGDAYIVEGDLTIKDVTRALSIPFRFIPKGDSAVFQGTFCINRLDFHVGKKSLFMGNTVTVQLNIPVAAK